MGSKKSDNPGIKLPPPVIFLSFFLIAVALKHFIPLVGIVAPIRQIIGAVLAVVGFSMIALALLKFREHRTTVLPDASASSMIQDGIFARTRNPIYLAFALLYFASAFCFQVVWAFLLFPFLLAAIKMYVIRREEAYLERRFGQEYLGYKGKVRRWL
jgi:protein-S-isoprenylcysteine O-methyltransferase Ste14